MNLTPLLDPFIVTPLLDPLLHSTTHDALNRRVDQTIDTVATGEVSATHWSWDGNANLTAVRETVAVTGTRSETRRYDNFDRLESITDHHGKTLDLGYDVVGNRTELTDAEGQVTTYTYDALNHNREVRVPGAGTTSQTWLPSGRLESISRPDAAQGCASKSKGVRFIYRTAIMNLTPLFVNQFEGARRETETLADLQAKHPNARIQSQVYLRTEDGKRAIDPLTGEGRRLDFVVIEEGKVVDVVETTSRDARKAEQALKELRIREAGGTFIRDRTDKCLLNACKIVTREDRRQ